MLDKPGRPKYSQRMKQGRIPTSRTFFIYLLFLSLLSRTLEAAPVRISFLDNDDTINQTLNLLLEKGCNSEAVNSFGTLIDWYNSATNDLDFKKFPPRKNGFYSFQSVSNLTAALPRPILFTQHRAEFNCFDTAILLAGSLMQTKLQPDDIAGPFLVTIWATNFVVGSGIAATPRDACNMIYPPKWIEATTNIFKEPMQSKRICLIPLLDAGYILPQATERSAVSKTLLKTLQSSWERYGVKFPTNAQVVSCYDVLIKGQHTQADNSHIGLLFQNQNQYVFIEKCGCTAPYVRLDFKDKKDLLFWLWDEIKPTVREDESLFVTFNDREIYDLEQIFQTINK